MNKKTKAILAGTMIPFAIQMNAFGVTLSDISGHWAEDEILQMVEKQAILGYPDGTFGPSKEVSKLDSWIMASRILGCDLSENESIATSAEQKYSSTLSKYITYGTKEISYLIEKGVIKESEIEKYLKNAKESATRGEATIIFTKVLGQEDSVKDNIVLSLPFGDFDKIDKTILPYIEYTYSEGIIQGVANTTGTPNMNADQVLKRSEMAVMLLRVSNKIEEEKEKNAPVITETGVIENVLTSSNQIKAVIENEVKTYDILSSTNITVDGSSASLSSISEGSSAEIQTKNNKLISVNAKSINYASTENKVITSISSTSVSVKEPGSKDSTAKQYSLSKYITYKNSNGDVITNSSLSEDSYVAVSFMEDGTVGKIQLLESSDTLKATLKSIEVDEYNIYINVTDENGNDSELVVLATASITRNKKNASLTDLKEGDELQITLLYGNVKKIVATGELTDGEGKILEISQTKNGIVLKIDLGDGEEGTYSLSSSATIKLDDVKAEVEDLKPGQSVDFDLDNSVITKIKATSVSSSTSENISGTITAINLSTVLENTGFVTIKTTDGETRTVLVNTSTSEYTKVLLDGEVCKPKVLDEDDEIVVYGEQSEDFSMIVASYIIVIN